MTACKIGSLIIPAAELAATSTVNNTEETTTKVTILNICQASSSPLSERNYKKADASEISDEQMSSIACKRTDSIRSIGSDIDVSLNNMEQSIVSNCSHNRTDELEVVKVEQHTIYQHEDNNNSSCYLSNQTLNCVKSGTGVLHQHQQNRTFSEDDSDLEAINSPIPYNKPITDKQSQHQPFTSVADSIAAGITNNLYNYDLMRNRPNNQSTTIFSSVNSLNDSESTLISSQQSVTIPSISKPSQPLASPKHKMSVIQETQQRPQFTTCTTIQIPDNDIDQELSHINGSKSLSGNDITNNKSSTLPAGAKPSLH